MGNRQCGFANAFTLLRSVCLSNAAPLVFIFIGRSAVWIFEILYGIK